MDSVVSTANLFTVSELVNSLSCIFPDLDLSTEDIVHPARNVQKTQGTKTK
jgi:hypothetical protein